MFSPDQVFSAVNAVLMTIHSIHLVCYHQPLTNIVAVVVAILAGMLGMYMYSTCPYRQACTSKVSMRAHMVHGLPVIVMERTVYVTQF